MSLARRIKRLEETAVSASEVADSGESVGHLLELAYWVAVLEAVDGDGSTVSAHFERMLRDKGFDQRDRERIFSEQADALREAEERLVAMYPPKGRRVSNEVSGDGD